MIPTTIRFFEDAWRIFVGDTPLRGRHDTWHEARSQQRRIAMEETWR